LADDTQAAPLATGPIVKILLLKTAPEEHVYSRFVDALHRALLELGHEAAISDQWVHAVRTLIPPDHLVEELVRSRPEAVVSFSSVFASLVLEGDVSLFDVLGVKFVSWLLDHPVYAPQSLRRELQGRLAVYSNADHARFAEAAGVPGRAMALLPGGEPVVPMRDHRDRSQPLFVAASWNGPPERFWDPADDSPATRLLVGVIDRLLADRRASLIDAFDETCAELGIGPVLGGDPASLEQMRSFLAGGLTYVRHLDRYNLITALAQAGLPMTVCGSGWAERLGGHRNVTCIESAPFRALPALYADARVVLNLNAGNGASERAIQAAFCGAAVATDYSREVDALFGGEAGAAFYNRARPETAVEAVARLLDDEGQAVARRGHERVVEQCGWLSRAQRIADFLAG
jgi:hypothetical protein